MSKQAAAIMNCCWNSLHTVKIRHRISSVFIPLSTTFHFNGNCNFDATEKLFYSKRRRETERNRKKNTTYHHIWWTLMLAPLLVHGKLMAFPWTKFRCTNKHKFKECFHLNQFLERKNYKQLSISYTKVFSFRWKWTFVRITN